MPTWELSATELCEELRHGRLSVRDVVTSQLHRIDEVDDDLGALVHLDPRGARQQAARLDATRAADSPLGTLHGLPLVIKDCLDVRGVPTRVGSAAFDDAPAAASDSAVVNALRRAGAIIIGKSRTHELAAGVTTPGTANPWRPGRSPGGSSGGSAAAVAAHLAVAAIGTDSLGSVRLPAAYCGVVGLKPTYGSIPTTGTVQLAWSLDHVGVLGRTVADVALVFYGIVGSRPPVRAASHVIGVPVELLDGIGEDALRALQRARAALEEEGYELRDVSVPEGECALPAAYAILMAEAATTHRRLLADRGELIGRDVRALLDAGVGVPAVTYLVAQQVRQHLRDSVRRLFAANGFAALLAPVAPASAHRHEQSHLEGALRPDPVTIACTRPNALFNVTGQPSLAVPVQLSPDGLPLGVQVATRPGDEAQAFRLGEIIEAAAAGVGSPRRQLADMLPPKKGER